MREDEATQIALSIQHARRIFKAVLEDHRVEKRYGWVEGCICWVEEGDGQDATERRVHACRTVWDAQKARQEGDDDDDGDDVVEKRDEWDEGWLQGSKQEHIPIVYAVLPKKALPRGAMVEWQLVAHDGRRVIPSHKNDNTDDDDDDDGDTEEGEAGSPTRSTFKVDLQATCGKGWQGEGVTSASKMGASTFGIMALSQGSRDRSKDPLKELSSLSVQDAGDIEFVTELGLKLKEALWVRVLFSVDEEVALECEYFPSPFPAYLFSAP